MYFSLRVSNPCTKFVTFFGPPNMPMWIKMVLTPIKTFLKRHVYCLHMLFLKIVLLQLNYVG
jgi:hypothetical protein